jgi:hypothetical protein
VVEGWWKGRSHNRPTNNIFRHIHDISEAEGIFIHTRYVPSKENPADGPSQGEYYPGSLLLQAITIPLLLRQHICNFDTPLTLTESHLIQQGKAPIPLPRADHSSLHQERAKINASFERHARTTFAQTQKWLNR